MELYPASAGRLLARVAEEDKYGEGGKEVKDMSPNDKQLFTDGLGTPASAI